jgi:arylsulfatase A-like enzyme
MLAQAGYRTAAVGDWAAGDLGKFPLGFEQTDLPDDQWNIRYLIRQGPKDLRLFLSLFTHNRFGKWFLPEIYYLAGIPLTREVGRDACATISTFATDGQPFFLNVFMAATHPPFGSEYPYYTLYSDPVYRGESKFLMARLTDPFEIIRRQGEPRHEFDLDQIISLYDGCVRSFDDEVARILDHLQACGLADNTIVVVYSDHGMEFFEHDTWGQGNSVRGDFSPKVPLILFDPRRPEGRVVPDIVRAVDLVPTLLDLLQLECPAHLEGKSLRPYLEQADAELALAAYAETGIWLTDVPGMPENHLRYPNLLELLEIPDKESGTLAIKAQYKGIIVRAKDRMVRRGRWKLVYQPLEEGCRLQLFDVEADPECCNDVSAQHPVELQDLRTLLRSWMEKDGQLTSLPPLDPSSPVQPKMASPSLPQA